MALADGQVGEGVEFVSLKERIEALRTWAAAQ
jgi:hypothetical protein